MTEPTTSELRAWAEAWRNYYYIWDTGNFRDALVIAYDHILRALDGDLTMPPEEKQ